jgi:uncharacterized OB-fold protein
MAKKDPHQYVARACKKCGVVLIQSRGEWALPPKGWCRQCREASPVKMIPGQPSTKFGGQK